MNSEIEKIESIVEFLEKGHDLDGTVPRPLLRSFAIRPGATSIHQMRIDEHESRLKYYKELLADLYEKRGYAIQGNKRTKI